MAAVTELTRADELRAFGEAVAGCTKCALAGGRTQVVFGSGDPESDLMFVGEAPGFHEDKQGVPFVGAAGKLLDQLLAGIGLTRDEVFVANVLKCRPPGNRDPQPEEIEACEAHLWRQIELIEPRVVATLGNFATKLLSGKPTGITRVHGSEQEVTLGGRRVLLYPIFHPAAALYTPRMLEVLKADFARLPELLGRQVVPPRQEAVRCARRLRAGGSARPLLIETHSPQDTERVAAELAADLRPGDVVTISGELGAGKTTFVRGACRALGVEGAVTSPTYTIGHRYAGRVDVSHLDLFRFRGVSPAEWGDLEPYFDDAVVFVEWPEAGEGSPPALAVRRPHRARRRRAPPCRHQRRC